MRKHGRRIGEFISNPFRNLTTAREGTAGALPLFIQSIDSLSQYISFDEETTQTLRKVVSFHSLKIPRHYLELMDFDNPLCPIRQQSVPSVLELQDNGHTDPLNENRTSVTPALVRRHEDRVVFLVTSRCAMYCRFCNRKRVVGKGWNPEAYKDTSIQYIKDNRQIREVILSGGDPFMLAPSDLNDILRQLREIPGLGIIRISTRMPVVHPDGLTEEHLEVIRAYAPLWIVVHINHPKEISDQFRTLARKIRESGNIIISQTVLLRGINDCAHILSNLFHNLLFLGIKPYYLFQLDEVTGAAHFKVRLEQGIRIMRTLREISSGLAMPHYALDITGGLGKVSLDYNYIKERKGNKVYVENPIGANGVYDDDGRESTCVHCGICGNNNIP